MPPPRRRYDGYAAPLPELAEARHEVLLHREFNQRQRRAVLARLDQIYELLLRRGTFADVTLHFTVKDGMLTAEISLGVVHHYRGEEDGVMVLDELAVVLQTAGVGTIGTTLFKGAIPQDTPATVVEDALVALIETPGLSPVHVHNQMAASFEQPTIQVVIRGAPYGYAAARQKAADAFLALDGLANVTLSGVEYLWVQALQSPFWLRTDELARPVLVFNVRIAKSL